MVRIPEYPAGGSVPMPVGNPESGALSVQSAGQFGRSVAQFGAAAAEVATLFQKERVESGVVDMEVRASKDFDAFKRSLREDPNFEGYQQKYDDFVKEKTQEYREAAAPGVWRRFENQFSRMVANNSIDVRQQGWTRQVDNSRATLNMELEDLADLHASTVDPIERARLLELGADAISSRAQNGFLTQEEATAEGIRFRNRVFDTQIRNDIQADPDSALRRLMEGEYEGMPEDRKTIWMERASAESEQRRAARVRAADREDRIAQRELKRLQQDTAADLYVKQAQGTLETEEVIAKAESGELALADLKTLLKTTADEDDVIVVGALYGRLMDGLDIRNELLEERQAGRITASTFNTMWTRNQSQLDRASPKTGYERGRSYLMTVLTPSEYESNLLHRQRKAQALLEFDSWTQANPGASDQDILTQAEDLARRAALVDPQELGSSGALLPRFLVGTREAPDFNASFQRLNQHYANKYSGDLQAIFNDPDYQRALNELQSFQRLSEGVK